MDSRDYTSRRLANDEEFRKEYFRKNLRFEISQLITEARIYKGLSQVELADVVGTQQPSIARIESGATLPSLSFLEKIALALGTYLIPPRFAFMEAQRVYATPLSTLAAIYIGVLGAQNAVKPQYNILQLGNALSVSYNSDTKNETPTTA